MRSCLASSRLSTRTSPTDPARSRRAIVEPNDPVPPVISTMAPEKSSAIRGTLSCPGRSLQQSGKCAGIDHLTLGSAVVVQACATHRAQSLPGHAVRLADDAGQCDGITGGSDQPGFGILNNTGSIPGRARQDGVPARQDALYL